MLSQIVERGTEVILEKIGETLAEEELRKFDESLDELRERNYEDMREWHERNQALEDNANKLQQEQDRIYDELRRETEERLREGWDTPEEKQDIADDIAERWKEIKELEREANREDLNTGYEDRQRNYDDIKEILDDIRDGNWEQVLDDLEDKGLEWTDDIGDWTDKLKDISDPIIRREQITGGDNCFVYYELTNSSINYGSMIGKIYDECQPYNPWDEHLPDTEPGYQPPGTDSSPEDWGIPDDWGKCHDCTEFEDVPDEPGKPKPPAPTPFPEPPESPYPPDPPNPGLIKDCKYAAYTSRIGFYTAVTNGVLMEASGTEPGTPRKLGEFWYWGDEYNAVEKDRKSNKWNNADYYPNPIPHQFGWGRDSLSYLKHRGWRISGLRVYYGYGQIDYPRYPSAYFERYLWVESYWVELIGECEGGNDKPPPKGGGGNKQGKPEEREKEEEEPMNCCQDVKAMLRLVREMHKALDPKDIADSEIPMKWLVPGRRGTHKMKTYPQIHEAMFRMIDRYMGVFPFSSDIPGGGKLKIHTISDAFKQLLQLGIDTESDVDRNGDILIRCLDELLIQHQLAVVNETWLEGIADYLDYQIDEDIEYVKMRANPLAGIKRVSLEKNEEKAEDVLKNYLKDTKVKVKVSRISNKSKEALTAYLVRIERAATIAAQAVSQEGKGDVFGKLLNMAMMAEKLNRILNQNEMDKDFDDILDDVEKQYPSATVGRDGSATEPYGLPFGERPRIRDIDGKPDKNE